MLVTAVERKIKLRNFLLKGF